MSVSPQPSPKEVFEREWARLEEMLAMAERESRRAADAGSEADEAYWLGVVVFLIDVRNSWPELKAR